MPAYFDHIIRMVMPALHIQAQALMVCYTAIGTEPFCSFPEIDPDVTAKEY